MIYKILLISFWWVSSLFGIYLLYQLTQYMKNKAPGHQSLLDALYIGLFNKWILSTIFLTAAFSLIELEIASQIGSLIFGWGSFTLMVTGHVHLMFCGIVKFGVTFRQEDFEKVSEKRTKNLVW